MSSQTKPAFVVPVFSLYLEPPVQTTNQEIENLHDYSNDGSQDTLLKDRKRQLVSIQPIKVQIAGLPCTVIISLSE